MPTVTTVQPGSGLDAAVAAATSGDVIRLRPGNYTCTAPFKAGVTIYGDVGATITTGTLDATGTGIVHVHNVTFANSRIQQNDACALHFHGCTFVGSTDFWGNASSTVFTLDGCTFDGLFAELMPLVARGCLFREQLILDLVDDLTLLHCTTLGQSLSYPGLSIVGVNNTVIRNCIFIETVDPGAPSGSILANVFGSLNSSHNIWVLSDNWTVPLDNTSRRVADAKVDVAGRLAVDSPARAIGGTPATNSYGPDRRACANDAGCFAFAGLTSALHTPWLLFDPAYGFSASDASYGTLAASVVTGTYRSPIDVGYRLATACVQHFFNGASDWLMLADGRLRLVAPFASATGNLVTSGHAGAYFGITALTGVSSITLTTPTVYTDLVNEDPQAPILPAALVLHDGGRVTTDAVPLQPRRYVSVQGITQLGADPAAIRRVMDDVTAGSPVRLWRRWDQQDPFDMDTAPLGYDDITPLQADAGSYDWLTSGLDGHLYRFAGVADTDGGHL
jgi:hypothetical protein